MPFLAGSGEPALLEGGHRRRVPVRLRRCPAEWCGAPPARMHLLTPGWVDDRIRVIDRLGLIDRVVGGQVDPAGADEWRAMTRAFTVRHGAALSPPARQPSGPLHHDLHRRDLLVDDGDVTAVLDFDEPKPSADPAWFCHYPAVERPDRRLPVDLAEAAVAGYRKVRALSRSELDLLPVAWPGSWPRPASSRGRHPRWASPTSTSAAAGWCTAAAAAC
ncbi:phosphotransferase enzyme family protein [Allonocardiopsis opalescens]